MKPFDVPLIWQHLPFHRGYPVPYFVYWDQQPDGTKTPNFHMADGRKWVTCLKYNKCWVCGQKLSASSFMITGPKGLANRVATDAFMHEACARESIRLCPHMLYQKAARRDADTDLLVMSAHHDLSKPGEIVLVKTGAFRVIFTGQAQLINYQPLAVQWFHYEGGVLTNKTHQLAPVDSRGWKVQRCPVISLSAL